MNFNKVDLNLFIVLDAIYTARNLTRAGEVLCITQPAVSNSLARLRDLFNDPLFVRTGQTMTPTPVAKNIIGPAREAIRLMQQSVQKSEVFDPLQADITFTFAMRDLFEAGIFPRLLPELESAAPRIRVHSTHLKRDEVPTAMASGRLDFYADTPTFFTEPHICKEKIAQDRYVVVARKGHPKIQGDMTLEKFLELGHAYISQRTEGAGPIDMALDRMGHTRNIVFRGHHLLTVPGLINKTDLVTCLPYHFCKHFDLAIYEMPFDTPPLEYFLYWHVSADHDPGHRWMRQQIAKVIESWRPPEGREVQPAQTTA